MLSNAVKVFSIGSFDIRLDPSWLVIAALITWSLSQQYFPGVLPGVSQAVYLAMALIAMLGLFASLLLHELAHSIVARGFGVPVRSITLFIFGGVAELEEEPSSADVEFWIAIAGPVMSFCLAAVFWTLNKLAYLAGTSGALIEVLFYLALVNLVLALFNLIPAFPLDGGRVLRAYLWHRTGDMLAATRTAAKSGALFGFALMTLGVVTLFTGATVGGLWQVMIGAFVLIAARATYAAQAAKVAFAGKTVAQLMTLSPITVAPEVTLSTLVNRIMLTHNVSFAPVVEDGVLLGYIDKSVLSRIDRENWANMQVGDVFVGLEDDVQVPPTLSLEDLLSRISNTGRRKFLVVRDHALLGVITLSDLARHLSQTRSIPQSAGKIEKP